MSESPSNYEIHPQIQAVFHAFDEAAIDWLLFRGEERMQRPTGDIDILIAPRDLEETDRSWLRSAFLVRVLRSWSPAARTSPTS